MAIVHIVLIKFKPNVDPNVVHQFLNKVLDLKKNCVTPQGGQPYIMNITGGLGNSEEGMTDGFTHGFTFIFNSDDDRKYYVEKDPAHDAIKAEMVDILEKVVVFDYEPSAF